MEEITQSTEVKTVFLYTLNQSTYANNKQRSSKI